MVISALRAQGMGLTETEDLKGGGGSPAGPRHLPQAQGHAQPAVGTDGAVMGT